MTQEEKDIFYMREALAEAYEAAELDEVPVGAIITVRDEIVSRGKNLKENERCAVCHAEIAAITDACRRMHGWRLPESTLYVTLEPCPMCAGAILNARIERVVFGTPDPKSGAFGSVLNLNDFPFNHHPSVTSGVCREECSQILTAYFKMKRAK